MLLYRVYLHCDIYTHNIVYTYLSGASEMKHFTSKFYSKTIVHEPYAFFRILFKLVVYANEDNIFLFVLHII